MRASRRRRALPGVRLAAGLATVLAGSGVAVAAAPGSDATAPRPAWSGSAFELRPAARDDPYGPRPRGIPQLGRDQVVVFALQNPAVKAADEQISAMKAQLDKIRWGWLPIIDTKMTVMPGANIQCDDIPIAVQPPDTETVDDFQWCRTGNRKDLQTIRGYFDQLGQAGIRFSLDAKATFPLTSFGKGFAARDMARHGVALRTLQRERVKAETTLRVYQAHASLLVAREAIRILIEAKNLSNKARVRVQRDLGDLEDFGADLSSGNPDRDPDDLHRVSLADVTLEEFMREARKTEALALAALWALAGEAAPHGFDIKEDRLEPWTIAGGLQDLQHYKDLAVRSRPEARMAAAATRVRKAQEKLARRSFLPDLGLVIDFGYAYSNAVDRSMSELYYRDRFNYSRLTAALALTWRMDFHNDTFDLRRAQAELRAAEYQRKAANLFLGRDVEEAYLELMESGYKREQYRRATELAWKLVVSQEQRDMVGGGNSRELLKALKDWYDWRFKHAKATLAYNVALARLSRAVGTALVAPPKAG